MNSARSHMQQHRVTDLTTAPLIVHTNIYTFAKMSLTKKKPTSSFLQGANHIERTLDHYSGDPCIMRSEWEQITVISTHTHRDRMTMWLGPALWLNKNHFITYIKLAREPHRVSWFRMGDPTVYSITLKILPGFVTKRVTSVFWWCHKEVLTP